MPKKRKQSTVVIVGRPNVGKSTLFNRIIGRRDAIVDDQPGVTRDSKYRKADWGGKPFWLVDTGGFFGPEEDPLTPVVQEQIERTARQASLLLFVLDGKSGLSPLDHEILTFLRRLDTPILAAVNKIDNFDKIDEKLIEFWELGLENYYPVSSLHGKGTGDLLDAIIDYLPDSPILDEAEQVPGIAILGRPNVGKSTLLNALCGSEKSIVSEIPGTTRDPVDTEIIANGKHYLLIDTAGIRRRSKMSQGIEHYTLKRAEHALERSDLALLMIDGVEGLTETDAKVFSLSQKMGKAAILLVNKWDAVEKDQSTSGEYAKAIRANIPFFNYAPIEFISAETKKRIHRIFPHLERILQNHARRVPTATLNETLEKILNHHPPPSHKGRTPRIYYWTQVSIQPPTFVAFTNDPSAIHFSYERFLINRLYDIFDFEGSPIRLYWKRRGGRQP